MLRENLLEFVILSCNVITICFADRADLSNVISATSRESPTRSELLPTRKTSSFFPLLRIQRVPTGTFPSNRKSAKRSQKNRRCNNQTRNNLFWVQYHRWRSPSECPCQTGSYSLKRLKNTHISKKNQTGKAHNQCQIVMQSVPPEAKQNKTT